ncbi:hypothetical protein SNE40_008431 [Patella caerulea]|uniref:Uncharacterized protein n=2 Tax=Patella caerulea TaxID=87958 RepID=A0AAN8PV56_PATCE
MDVLVLLKLNPLLLHICHGNIVVYKIMIFSFKHNPINEISVDDDNNSILDNNGFDEDNEEFDVNALTTTEDFKHVLGLALLKFETVHLIPISTINDIISNISYLHSLSLSNLKLHLKDKMNGLDGSNTDIESILQSEINKDFLTNFFSNSEEYRFTSNFKRQAFYKETFGLVEPISIELGLNGSNKKCQYHYVPLKQTLDSLLSNNSVKHQLEHPQNLCFDNIFTDIIDGESFKRNPYFSENPSALKLVMYQDAFEIVNPLGSAKKTFKLVGFYLTLADFYPQFRSKIENMQLALICKESDLEYFGNKVLDPLIRDIKDLSTGVYLSNNIFVKANLLCLVGDNLGSHWIGGFVTNFGNAKYFCRFCCVNRDLWVNNHYVYAPLRNRQSYTQSIHNIENNDLLHDMGIKSECLFHNLLGFHVCNPGLPPCIGHDLFEGVVKYDLTLFLKEII